MRGHVAFKRAICCKGAVTDEALIRFEARMSSDVRLQHST